MSPLKKKPLICFWMSFFTNSVIGLTQASMNRMAKTTTKRPRAKRYS